MAKTKIRSPRKNKPPPEAGNAALRLLTRREHSAKELKRKLTARGVESAAADAAIGKLAASGFQSDQRYAEQMIRTRLAQGYGPRRIRADLQVAGLSNEAVASALAAIDVDWRDQAQAAFAKRFGRIGGGMAERQKHYRFLASRGFETGHIQAVLKGEAFDD